MNLLVLLRNCYYGSKNRYLPSKNTKRKSRKTSVYVKKGKMRYEQETIDSPASLLKSFEKVMNDGTWDFTILTYKFIVESIVPKSKNLAEINQCSQTGDRSPLGVRETVSVGPQRGRGFLTNYPIKLCLIGTCGHVIFFLIFT